MTMPERMQGDVVREMEQLTIDYPYFSIGQALLAIAYQNIDDDRYDSQLRRAAASMPNRLCRPDDKHPCDKAAWFLGIHLLSKRLDL